MHDTAAPRPAVDRYRHWSSLIGASIAITILSLSIHVVMLQVLGVPYPDTQGRLGLWGLLYPVAQSLGLVFLAATTAPALRRFPPVIRWLSLALLFSAMNGAVRNALMAGVTTTDYIAPAAGLIHQLAFNLVLAALALVVTAVIHNTAGRAVAAVVLAIVALRVIAPALGGALAPLTGWMAAYAHPEVHVAPYGPNVLIPSYASFAETVVACLVARYLATLRDVTWDPHGLLRYGLLVLLVRGTLVMMTVFGPMIGANPADGLVRMSQFFLQDVAMILLIQAVFRRLRDPHVRATGRET